MTLLLLLLTLGAPARPMLRGPEAQEVQVHHLPPPFSAEALREGIPQGTEMVLRLETAGQPTVLQRWLFTAADAQGCTIHAWILSPEGEELSDEGEGRSTWAELESHAHFPARRTTRTDSSVSIAAGELDTWRFEVAPEAEGEPVKVFHFSPAHPGPPVLMEVRSGQEVLTRMELVSRSGP